MKMMTEPECKDCGADGIVVALGAGWVCLKCLATWSDDEQ